MAVGGDPELAWQRVMDIVEQESGEAPISGDPRLSPAALRTAQRVVEVTEARRLLELGSGASTVMFAGLCRDGSRQLDSVDGEVTYLDATRQGLAVAGLAGTGRLHHAPLGVVRGGGYVGLGYQLGPVLAQAPFDFVLIDGPPALDIGRFMTLVTIWPHLSVGAIVLLDDAGRDALEGRWMAQWQEIFGASLRLHLDRRYAKGLAVLQKIGPGGPKRIGAIWWEQARRAARHVVRRWLGRGAHG